jgi:MFS family permease
MDRVKRVVAGTWQAVQRNMRGNVAVFATIFTLGNFGRQMAFPYLSLYILALGGRPEQIGQVGSLAPLLGLVVFPLGGYLADHVGRVKLVGTMMLIAAAIELIYALAPTWQWLLLAALLMGVGSMQFPASSALIADSTLPQERSRAIAIMNTISMLPAMAAPWVAGLVVDGVGVDPGVRYLYGFMALANAVSGVIALRWLRETQPATGDGFRLTMLPRLLRDTYNDVPRLVRAMSGSVRAMLVIAVLGFAVNAIVGPFWVVYAVEEMGLSATQWGSILLLETVVRNLTLLPAGVLGDRLGRSRCMIASLLMLAVALPLFIVVQGYVGVLAVRLVIGVANALFIPTSIALLADTVPREFRGRMIAAIGQGGVMIGASSGGTGGPALGYLVTLPLMATSLVAGYIYSGGPRLPWLVSLGLVLVTLAVSLAYLRDPHQAEA